MIEVHDLRKAYGDNVAVDGVSFSVNAGETFGLLGPNGAGKSTTIHMLVGGLRADGGRVVVAGREDPTRSASRQKIGIAPQASALYDDLTGRENLRFFARLYRIRGAKLRNRVAWSLDFVGLADRAEDYVRTYSGGMKRRLNIAAAVVADPSVVLLDEPTVGVDPQSRNHMFANIEQLKQAGKTILYTTHYMEEAQRLCDRVAIMDHGRILQLDTVDGLIQRFGGASVVEVELTPGHSAPSSLRGAHKLSVEETNGQGASLRIDTREPDDAIAQLVAAHTRFRSVRIHRPDLESVFLNLTGRRLRD